MMSFDEMYDKLIELDITTENEINLVCKINGYTIDTLNDILYAKTGYRELEDVRGMNHYIITLYYHNELQPIIQKLTETSYANAINKALNNSKKQQKIDRIDITEATL